jgi:RNA polymerase sigma-70 factor (ECF subfamily)
MTEADSSSDWVQRLRQGDPEAAAQLFAEYARWLTHVAKQYLSVRLAGRVDGEDVVQSVFRTFFRRSAQGDLRIDSTAQIWRLLVKITILKARARARQHTAAMRDVTTEAGDDWLAAATSEDPGPAEAAELVDLLEAVLRGLPPLYCHVLDLRLQGYGAVEIGEHLQISRRTVHRALGLMRQRLANSIGSAD